MNGKTFEKYLVTLFEKLGYEVELTKFTGDYGADHVLSKDGVKTVVHTKRHKSKVGAKGCEQRPQSVGPA